jgi:acetylornithine deacetylase/succinyl-diaminopimelate desuccinylase-like protein
VGGPDGAFNLVLRVPPLVDAGRAVEALRAALEDNASYQARVTFSPAGSLNGWNAPETASWFERAINDASRAHFDAPCGFIGQTGTIPFMHIVGQRYPSAQTMVCGVLGPRSNAHGPNEFLHVPYAKKLSAVVAEVIARLP